MKDSMHARGGSREEACQAHVSGADRSAFRPTTEHDPLGECPGSSTPDPASRTRNHHARR